MVSDVNHTQMIHQALRLNLQGKCVSLVRVTVTRSVYIMHQMERKFGISHQNPALVKIDQIESTLYKVTKPLSHYC
jgi:hypothetical protein